MCVYDEKSSDKIIMQVFIGALLTADIFFTF